MSVPKSPLPTRKINVVKRIAVIEDSFDIMRPARTLRVWLSWGDRAALSVYIAAASQNFKGT
jgi:hypothetical protein